MSIRTSVLLVTALAMIAGYVFFVQLRQTTDAEEEPPWFYSVDMVDMSKITIADRGEEATFVLGDDNRWHIDNQEGLPVGLDRWGGITLLLSGPKTRRLLDAHPTDLEPYGLDSPPIRIEVLLKDGRVIPVLLGVPTPDGVGYYAQVEGFSQVYTVVAGWGEVLTRLVAEPPLPEWYYGNSSFAISGFELVVGEETMAIMLGVDGWHFGDEGRTLVTEEQFDRAIAALDPPAVQQIAAYNPTFLAEFGLDEPSFTFLLRTEGLRLDGVNVITQVRYIFGDPTEDGERYFVMAERDEMLRDVFQFDAQWVETLLGLAQDPSYLRGKLEES